MNILDLAKQVAAAGTALAMIGAAYVGFVGAVQGRVVPWVTPDEARSIMREGTVSVQRYIDDRECEDYLNRYGRARDALARNSGDMVALDLAYASLKKIKEITGCKAP